MVDNSVVDHINFFFNCSSKRQVGTSAYTFLKHLAQTLRSSTRLNSVGYLSSSRCSFMKVTPTGNSLDKNNYILHIF